MSTESVGKKLDAAALRALQRPLKDAYRQDGAQAIVVSEATAHVDAPSVSATFSTLAGDVRAGLHPATGGDGTEACSADILMQALVACAGVTLGSVATAMSIDLKRAEVTAKGTWDARGTLGVDKDAPIGLTAIELNFDIETDADAAAVAKLLDLTERYCVIAQTLASPPTITVTHG